MCVGLVQIAPSDFWRLTFADTIIIVRGYYLNMGYRSSDFRNLLTLNYNVNSKHKKNPQQLWPLNIDTEFKKQYSDEELKKRNDKIRQLLKNKKK